MMEFLLIQNIPQLLYLAVYTITVMLSTAFICWMGMPFKISSPAAESSSQTEEAESKSGENVSQPFDATQAKETFATEESLACDETHGKIEATTAETASTCKMAELVVKDSVSPTEDEQTDNLRARRTRNYRQLSVNTDSGGLEKCKKRTSESTADMNIYYPVDEEIDEVASSISPNDNARDEDCMDTSEQGYMEELKNHREHQPDTDIATPVAQAEDVKHTENNDSRQLNVFNFVHSEQVHINVAEAQVTSHECSGNLENAQILSMLSGSMQTIIDNSKQGQTQVSPTSAGQGSQNESPPDYESLVKETNRGSEKESETPSSSIELDGKTYNLETASDQDECFRDYLETPEDLVELITEVCADEDVSSATLHQSSTNGKELWVVGVGADERVEKKLKEAVQERFPTFSIFTDRIESYTEHTINYAKRAFIAISELFNQGKGRYEEVSTATCEMILKADRQHSSTSYYAFVPAHFILDETDCKMLNAEDVHEGAPKHVQDNTAKNALDRRYILQLFNPRKTVSIQPSDSMFVYRQYQDGVDQGPSHFSSFYNDSCLMEIDKTIFYETLNGFIVKTDLEEAMKTRQDGSVIGNILPVKDAKELVKMGAKRFRVKVGPASGHLIFPGIPLQIGKKKKKPGISLMDDRPQLHHAQFILDDWPLKSGHSGSIIHVVDSQTGTLYPFGMLVGEARGHKRKDQTIFQALVLQPAIEELESTFGHKIQNLTQLNRSVSQAGDEDFTTVASRLTAQPKPPSHSTASQASAKVDRSSLGAESEAAQQGCLSSADAPKKATEIDASTANGISGDTSDETMIPATDDNQYKNAESLPASGASSSTETSNPAAGLVQSEHTASFYLEEEESQQCLVSSLPKESLAPSKSDDSGFSQSMSSGVFEHIQDRSTAKPDQLAAKSDK